MKSNRNLYILLIIGFILISMVPFKDTALVAPSCIVNDDCHVPIPENYCDVEFGCFAGQCYEVPILCPEICDSGKDEDMDGKVDCDDNDCWSSPSCSCEQMSFNKCKLNRCWCPEGKFPKWVVAEEDSYCNKHYQND